MLNRKLKTISKLYGQLNKSIQPQSEDAKWFVKSTCNKIGTGDVRHTRNVGFTMITFSQVLLTLYFVTI